MKKLNVFLLDKNYKIDLLIKKKVKCIDSLFYNNIKKKIM